MSCPRCGCAEAYFLKTRAIYKCISCAKQYSETTGTLWHSPKIPMEKRQAIIKDLQIGKSILQVSEKHKVGYKTVWNIAKKVKQPTEIWSGK